MSVDEKLDLLMAQMDNRMDQMDNRMDQMDKRFDQLNAQLVLLKENVEEQTTVLKSLISDYDFQITRINHALVNA